MHVRGPNSPHNNAERAVNDLLNVTRYIDKVLNKQTSEES